MGFWDHRIDRAPPSGRAPAPQPPAAHPAAPQPPAAQAPAPDRASDADDRVARFDVAAPRYRLADVVLPESARVQLDGLVAKVEHHRTLYEAWGLASIDPSGRRVAINLYGPPGTGKTMCAEGIAERLSRPIVTVSYAELESKYVGETPKNIVAAFEAAKRHGAVLFFDEADSILGRRLTSVTQSADHGVNVSRSVMLLQLDHFESVVIFATNLAKNYDGAFVRRILGHVEIPLPDAAGRERLATRLLPPSLPRAHDVTTAWLASISDGLSGGEMLHLVVGAATRAVQRSADAQRVTRDDLEAEARAFRAARHAVGIDAPPPRIDEREATDDESAAVRERRQAPVET